MGPTSPEMATSCLSLELVQEEDELAADNYFQWRSAADFASMT